jgi:hypothetical protein
VDEENDWSGEVEWTDRDEGEGPDQDVTDESAAYLEFLDQEVCWKLSEFERSVITDMLSFRPKNSLIFQMMKTTN